MSLQMRVGFLLVLLLSAAIISQSEGGWWGRVWGGIRRVCTLMFVSPRPALRVCVCVCVTEIQKALGGGVGESGCKHLIFCPLTITVLVFV